MKRYITAVITAALAVAPAFAQNRGPLRANVPFDFTVGKATLPAGAYDVKLENQTILIRAVDGHGAAMAVTRIGQVPGEQVEPALVFTGTGQRHYLDSVWTDSGARELTVHNDSHATVTVVRAVVAK